MQKGAQNTYVLGTKYLRSGWKRAPDVGTRVRISPNGKITTKNITNEAPKNIKCRLRRTSGVFDVEYVSKYIWRMFHVIICTTKIYRESDYDLLAEMHAVGYCNGVDMITQNR